MEATTRTSAYSLFNPFINSLLYVPARIVPGEWLMVDFNVGFV